MGEDSGGELIRLPVRAAEVSADVVLEDMLEGWGQQQMSRNFKVARFPQFGLDWHSGASVRSRSCAERRSKTRLGGEGDRVGA